MSEPVVATYTFNFVVRAQDWNEVITIFKNELGITKKYNSSERPINGLFLVSCTLSKNDLTKSFYQRIARSKNIAIHSDGKSVSLYPKILHETRLVEEKLRWLLLHVSDAIEDYAKLLGYEKNDIVEKEKLDPLTSRLSFEAMIGLLEMDQSWARDGVSDQKMRALISDSADFESFRTVYLKRTTPKTVWASISELVLQRPVEWETIAPKLKTIKALRNKCAHFHTVTDADLEQAKHLRTQIMQNLARKRTYSPEDFKAFTELSKQVAEIMKGFSESYAKNMVKLFESTNAAQNTLQQLAGVYKPIDFNALTANQAFTKNFFSPRLDTGLKKSSNADDTFKVNDEENEGDDDAAGAAIPISSKK